MPAQSRVSKRGSGRKCATAHTIKDRLLVTTGRGCVHAEIDVLPEQEVQPAKVVQFTAAAR